MEKLGIDSKQWIIGKRIAELRQKNNLTQSELASKLCVSREMINYWEKGSRDIKTGNIVLLAEALDTTCDYLLGLSNATTTDADLRAVCDYTGLSVEAIDFIKNTPGIDIELLQRFVSVQKQFGEMLEILNYKK